MSIFSGIKRRWINYRGRNVKLDKEALSLSDKVITEFLDKEIIKYDRRSDDFWQWLKLAKLTEFLGYPCPHKKALEFFFSANLLKIDKSDVILDAAGGMSNYLSGIRNIFQPQKLILHDRIFNDSVINDGILIIGGDISNIPLPDNSVNKISCHHSFEHFQENRDTLFIKEISRLLKRKGRAVIIPIFIAAQYIECWNIRKSKKFDENAKLVIDESATLPGGDADGHFARIYNVDSLKTRVLGVATKCGLNWTFVTCTLDGQDIPDMHKNVGAKINCPLRALILDKNKK